MTHGARVMSDRGVSVIRPSKSYRDSALFFLVLFPSLAFFMIAPSIALAAQRWERASDGVTRMANDAE